MYCIWDRFLSFCSVLSFCSGCANTLIQRGYSHIDWVSLCKRLSMSSVKCNRYDGDKLYVPCCVMSAHITCFWHKMLHWNGYENVSLEYWSQYWFQIRAFVLTHTYNQEYNWVQGGKGLWNLMCWCESYWESWDGWDLCHIRMSYAHSDTSYIRGFYLYFVLFTLPGLISQETWLVKQLMTNMTLVGQWKAVFVKMGMFRLLMELLMLLHSSNHPSTYLHTCIHFL